MNNALVRSLAERGVKGTLELAAGYAAWYWQKACNRERTVIKKVHDYRMLLDLDDPGISTTLGRGGTREREHSLILREEVKEGDTVLDIGANLGYYALMEAALAGPAGTVYAAEPSPRNYALLVRNVELNGFGGRILTFPLAFSDTNGSQPLYLSRLSNLNTLFPAPAQKGRARVTEESVEVKTTTLSSFVKDKPGIRFIRMDIEGAEAKVLSDLASCAKAKGFTPSVLFETHLSKYGEGLDMEKALRLLFEAGYFVKKLVSNRDNGSKWQGRGLKPQVLVRTDGMTRGIYTNVPAAAAIELICREGGVRAALLEFRI